MRIDWLPALIRKFSLTHNWFTGGLYSPRPHIRPRFKIGVPSIEALEGRVQPALTLPIGLPLPAPPVALPDTYAVTQNVPFTGNGVLSNDTDLNNDPLTAVLASSPTNGTLVFNSNGTFTYTPSAGFVGVDTFTYYARDGQANSILPGLVTLVVSPLPNSPPVANNDDFYMTEDSILNISLGTALDGVLANDTDSDILGLPDLLELGDLVLVANLVTPPQHGTFLFLPTGTFIYTPDPNFTGIDTFTYQVSDLISLSNVATATIHVGAVNDPPVSGADTYSTSEDTPLNIAAPGVLANDTDVEGSPLTAVLAVAPSNGTVVLNPNGSFTYTPNPNFNGIDTFQYRASDGGVQGNEQTVTIVVNGVTDSIVANNDAYSTTEDGILTVLLGNGVLANDSNPDGGLLFTAAVVTQPQHGLLVFLPTGAFVYTPDPNFNGTDTFTYQASSLTANSNIATVSITVTGVNDAPLASPDNYTTAEDQALTISAPGLLSNDSDPDGNPLTALLVTPPLFGTVVVNPNGSFTYTPSANYQGIDVFTYKANDGSSDSLPTAVSITVSGSNDAPVAVNDSYTVTEDSLLNVVLIGGVLANDTDADLDLLTAVLVSGPQHGTLTLLPTGAFTYTPAPNYSGPDSFTYRASDGTTVSNVATVSITVTDVNDAPVANPNQYSAVLNTPLTINGTIGVLSNDSDADGQPLTAVLATGPSHGTLVLNPDGSFTYTPGNGFTGSDSFTYRASDGTALSQPATVTISVSAAPNFVPVAFNDTFSLQEDVALDLTGGTGANGVLGNDTDQDVPVNAWTQLSAILVSGPSHGSLTLQSNGTFLYTPDADYSGADSFTYLASDGSSFSNVATVTLNISSVNDAPVSGNDSYTTAEETALNITAPGVLSNDTDADLNSLTAVLVVGPAHGTLTLNPNGSFTYTPAANYSGPDSFTYRANDGTTVGNIATVSINVTNTNDAPVGVTNSYQVNEDAVLNVVQGSGVLSNDTDADGNTLTAILVAQPQHGTLTLSANGAFQYTPDANFSGTDTFTYQASDGQALSTVTSVSITVSPLNDAPVSAADNYVVTGSVLNVNAASGVLANDSDPDGDNLTASLVAGPAHGQVTLNANGSFSYTPTVGYSGSDSFTYRASDGSVNGAITTVTLSVTSVANRAPVAQNDSYATTEDAVFATTLANGVLFNDTDADGNTLTASLVSGPSHGTVVLNANGTFTYTPQANYAGSDSFTYQANDGSLNSGIATVSITITGVNDAPVGGADSYNVLRNQTLVVGAPGVLGNDVDVDGNSLTATLVSSPTHGVLTFNANGSFNYTPDPNYSGNDSFTYRANDGITTSSPITVTLVVSSSNQIPVSLNDSYTVVEDTTLTVLAVNGVLKNDTDGDGDSLTASVITQPAHGTLTLGANGSFVYTPNANFSGTDSFSYAASDGTATGTAALVTITVTGVNDAPVAVNDSFNVPENQALVVTTPGVLLNDTDADGDALTAAVVSQPSHGTLVLNANGSFTYTPATNYVGADSFTYRVSDGTTNSGVATVSLTVLSGIPINTAPVSAPDAYTTAEDTVLTVLAANGVLSNDTDVDSNPLTAIIVNQPAHGVVALAANGSLVYTPNPNFSGTDTFTYVANDGTASGTAALVTITVTAVNDAPVAGNDSYAVVENLPLTVGAPGVMTNDSDAEGSALTASLVANPSHGSVIFNADGSFVYTPAPNYTGSDSFSYRVSDGSLNSATATVNLSVNSDGVNHAPSSVGDSYTVVEDNTLTVLAAAGVLSNDSDADGNTLSALVVSQPSHGTLALAADGSLVYTPNANYTGSDSFTYVANDGTTNGNTVTVTITITAVNDAPNGVADTYATSKNIALTVGAPGVLANDTDVDSNSIIAILASGPSHGTIALNPDGSFVYTPANNYVGADSFTYRASDGLATGNLVTVTLNVSDTSGGPLDSPPVVTTSSGARTVRGHRKLILDPAVTVTDSDSPVFNNGKMDVVIRSGAGTNDSLTFGRGGARRGFVNVRRNVVKVGLVQVGTLTGGLRGVPIQITFNSNATLALVQKVAQSIIFRGSNHQGGVRVVSIQVTDNTNLVSNLGTKSVNVT